MEEPVDETICITRFLQEFDHATIGDDVQLRGGIVGSYSLPPEDVEGEVTDWALQYLEQRKCPYTLAVSLAKNVAEQLSSSVHQRVLQSNGTSKEDGTKRLLDSSQLHMETINNLHELCSQWKDRPEIANASVSWIGYEIRHATSVCAIKNGRRKMEDRHVVLHDLNTFCGIEDAPHHSYYAVFDGHAGVDAASFAAAHLHKNIVNHPAFLTDTETAIKVAFHLTDEQFLDRSSREGIKSGCTAVCGLIREQTLYLAWLGDSQAILVQNGRLQTIMSPHKPDRQDEKKRIEDLHGYVLFNNGTWRVSGTLAVSRALGDPEYKPFVSSEPDVATIPFDGSEDFLILACDGLWDRLSPSDAALAVYHHLANSPDDVENLATRLVHQAKEQGSSDNITAIVVFLRDLPSLIASAPSNILLLSQGLQTENRTHMINGDNHLLECHKNETTEQAVEKPNVLELTSGFMPHCPQTEYNLGNPFSDFLQVGENGPEGTFRYQAMSKGMAPEATALSELPTPPIDEIIAAQQFEMASSDTNPFQTQNLLLSSSDLHGAALSLPEEVVDPSEAKELASEIVNLAIETAVRQVSTTPPPQDYSSEEQQQDDSGLEEGPLEDSELSPEFPAAEDPYNMAGAASSLSPYAEPFYPASLRPQPVTSDVAELDILQDAPLEKKTTDMSAATEDEANLMSEPSTSDICLEQSEDIDELLPSLPCDPSQIVTSNEQFLAELDTDVPRKEVESGMGEIGSDNLVCFDQDTALQHTNQRDLLEDSLISMAPVSLGTFEEEPKGIEIPCVKPDSSQDTSVELFNDSFPTDTSLHPVSQDEVNLISEEPTETALIGDFGSAENFKNLLEDENDKDLELQPSIKDLVSEDTVPSFEYPSTNAPSLSDEIGFPIQDISTYPLEAPLIHSEDAVDHKISDFIPEDLLTAQQKTEIFSDNVKHYTSALELPEDFQSTEPSGSLPLQDILQPTIPPEQIPVEKVLQATIVSETTLIEAPIEYQESEEILKKIAPDESCHIQPIATSSPIATESQPLDLHEPSSEVGLSKEPLLTDSSLAQGDKPSALDQFVEPLSANGSFLPAIQATLLEVTGAPVPTDSLADDIPQGVSAVIEDIPDHVPEAEGVTEDVDSDSEKDGGWSYIKVNASQEPPAPEKTEETPKPVSTTSEEKAKKQPIKASTVKTIKKDLGKPLDSKLKSKPGITADKAKGTVASVANAKERTSTMKPIGAKQSLQRKPVAPAPVKKTVSATTAKTSIGPSHTTKQPVTSKLTSAQPSTMLKSSRMSAAKPPVTGTAATKSLSQKSVPPSTTSTTSRARPSLTGTRPASAPSARPKDVSSSLTSSAKPGSASSKLNSTEANRSSVAKSQVSTLKPSPLKQPTSTSTVQRAKNASTPAQGPKEVKTASNMFKVPSSGAVRKTVPKIDTKQTKDNVNKQISAKTPLKAPVVKSESTTRQSLPLGRTESKGTTRRVSAGTTPRIPPGKTPIQSKDLKSKQPIKKNQTVQSKPKSISEEPKKESKDLQTPEQEKGSLEANNRETAVGDSSGATPETPISSSVTSSVSEEQPAIKAEDEEIHLDSATAHVEGGQH